jgi:hypothetical protein
MGFQPGSYSHPGNLPGRHCHQRRRQSLSLRPHHPRRAIPNPQITQSRFHQRRRRLKFASPKRAVPVGSLLPRLSNMVLGRLLDDVAYAGLRQEAVSDLHGEIQSPRRRRKKPPRLRRVLAHAGTKAFCPVLTEMQDRSPAVFAMTRQARTYSPLLFSTGLSGVALEGLVSFSPSFFPALFSFFAASTTSAGTNFKAPPLMQ